MSDKIIYWTSVVCSVLSLLLMIANTALVSSNRSLQIEAGNRQATINAAVNLTQLNQGLAQALADVAINKEDKSIRDLLASQGILLRKSEKAADKPAKAN